jgi:hypothetical protein
MCRSYPRRASLSFSLGRPWPEAGRGQKCLLLRVFTPLSDPLPKERNAPRTRKNHKTYPRPFRLSDNGFGFRGGRHELSHLCPETSGACPRVGCDSPKLRQGVRPGRGALNDRPHLPDALESGWRQPGKTPRTGCRGHHGHRRPSPGHPGVRRHPVPSHPSA